MFEQSTTVTLAPARKRSPRIDRWFYIGVALTMILMTAFAFAPALIDQSRRNQPLPLSPLVIVHALVSALWLLLFLTQATLAAIGRTDVHRRVGVFGAGLTVVFVGVGYFTVLEEARRGFDLSGDISRLAPPGATARDALVATVGLLFNFLLFTLLAGAALLYRNRPAVHKRLMVLAVLVALTPTPVAHVLGYWFAPQPWLGLAFLVSGLFFLSLSAVHDRIVDGRVHPVSLWVPAGLFAVITVLTFVVQPSASWARFAAWLIR